MHASVVECACLVSLCDLVYPPPPPGASLELPLSLHNQGVVEMEHVLLLQEREDPPPQPPTKQLVSSEVRLSWLCPTLWLSLGLPVWVCLVQEIDPRRLSMAQGGLASCSWSVCVCVCVCVGSSECDVLLILPWNV